MIKLDKIIKIYNPKKANEYEALHGVSCEISDGEMVAIIGKSGAEKSSTSAKSCITMPIFSFLICAYCPSDKFFTKVPSIVYSPL